jgi:hypothetical protein
MKPDEFYTFRAQVLPNLRAYYSDAPMVHIPTRAEQKMLLQAFDYLEALHRSGDAPPAQMDLGIPMAPIAPGSAVYRATHGHK